MEKLNRKGFFSTLFGGIAGVIAGTSVKASEPTPVVETVVYCEPEYSRKFDVELQTKLAIKNARKLNEEMNEGVTCDIPDDYFVSFHDNYDDFVDELKAIVDIAQVYV